MSTTVAAAALLSDKDAAELLHARPQTLRAWRNRRKGPAFYKLSGRILYKREDLEAWIARCRVVPGEQSQRMGVRRGRGTCKSSR
jgi:hypothetical protein